MDILNCVNQWIDPLTPALPDLADRHLKRLRHLEEDLAEVLTTLPTLAGGDRTERADRLLAVRIRLAERVRAAHDPADTGAGVTAVVQALTGFVCGFYDLDLRDAVGPGHGRMILRRGSDGVRHRWAMRLTGGDLVGIAATERHGGSRLQEITTRAVLMPGGWWINGEKCWVSRLNEASAFVVFFKDPDSRITAALVEADRPGLRREPATPAGLGGWAWGSLAFNDVPITAADLLGGPGAGTAVFREHFAAFRPLVAATALGTAAGVHTTVADTLRARLATGILPRLRDTALVTLGRTHIELNAALLAVLAAARLAASNQDEADLWSRSVKAHAVDTAHRVASELPLLVGASGFQADSRLAKARGDLGGLLYADGIHDSLLRSAGRILTSPAAAATPEHVQDRPALAA